MILLVAYFGYKSYTFIFQDVLDCPNQRNGDYVIISLHPCSTNYYSYSKGTVGTCHALRVVHISRNPWCVLMAVAVASVQLKGEACSDKNELIYCSCFDDTDSHTSSSNICNTLKLQIIINFTTVVFQSICGKPLNRSSFQLLVFSSDRKSSRRDVSLLIATGAWRTQGGYFYFLLAFARKNIKNYQEENLFWKWCTLLILQRQNWMFSIINCKHKLEFCISIYQMLGQSMYH